MTGYSPIVGHCGGKSPCTSTPEILHRRLSATVPRVRLQQCVDVKRSTLWGERKSPFQHWLQLGNDFYIHTFSPTLLPGRESTQSEVGEKKPQANSRNELFQSSFVSTHAGPTQLRGSRRTVHPLLRQTIYFGLPHTHKKAPFEKRRGVHSKEEKATSLVTNHLPCRSDIFPPFF